MRSVAIHLMIQLRATNGRHRPRNTNFLGLHLLPCPSGYLHSPADTLYETSTIIFGTELDDDKEVRHSEKRTEGSKKPSNERESIIERHYLYKIYTDLLGGFLPLGLHMSQQADTKRRFLIFVFHGGCSPLQAVKNLL